MNADNPELIPLLLVADGEELLTGSRNDGITLANLALFRRKLRLDGGIAAAHISQL